MFSILKKTSPKEKYRALLLADLSRTQDSLELAYANFQHVVEPDLIDSYIYEVNAMQLRYKYLLTCLREYSQS